MAEPFSSSFQAGVSAAAQLHRMQELRSKDAMRRIQERLATENLNHLIQERDRALAMESEVKKATSDFQLMQSQFLPTAFGVAPNPAYTPDTGVAALKSFGKLAQNPEQFMDLAAKSAQISASQALAQQRQADAAVGEWNPTTGSVATPSGRELEYVKKGPQSIELVGSGDVEIVEKNGRQFQIDVGGRANPLAQDIEGRQLRVDELKRLKDEGHWDLLEIDPKLGAFVLPQKNVEAAKKALGIGAGMTTATRTKLEGQIANADTTIQAAKSALRTINETPESLGLVKGMLGQAKETAKGLAGIPQDPKISKARDKLRQDFVKLSADLKVDSGNMSLYERTKLEQAGDPTRWDEYYERTAPKMQAMLDAAVGRKLRLTRELGKEPDDDLLRSIPIGEVGTLFDSNLLSEDDLLKLVIMQRITPSQAREINTRR